MAEPSMTTTTTKRTVFTRQMVDRMLGRPSCDVSDVPFCGWGDLIPERPTFLGSVWSDTPLDFDGVDDRLTTIQQIAPSFFAVIVGKVSDESVEHLRAFAAAHYGTVTTVDAEPEPPAMSSGVAAVVAAAKAWRTASIEWGKAARRGEVLGIAADHRDDAVDALIVAVDALLAAERASTEEDDDCRLGCYDDCPHDGTEGDDRG